MNISIVISIGTLVFCFIMFFYFSWYIKRRISSSELLAERQKEVYRLIAEIDSITDRDAQLVEERIKTLRTLLDDTEKRIAVYVNELEKSRTSEALYTSLGRGIRDALNTPVKPAPAPVEVLSNQPALTVIRNNTTASPPAAQQHEVSAPLSGQQIRPQIDLLIGEGFSQSEIASRLGISIAEVNLAMNLIGRK